MTQITNYLSQEQGKDFGFVLEIILTAILKIWLLFCPTWCCIHHFRICNSTVEVLGCFTLHAGAAGDIHSQVNLLSFSPFSIRKGNLSLLISTQDNRKIDIKKIILWAITSTLLHRIPLRRKLCRHKTYFVFQFSLVLSTNFLSTSYYLQSRIESPLRRQSSTHNGIPHRQLHGRSLQLHPLRIPPLKWNRYGRCHTRSGWKIRPIPFVAATVNKVACFNFIHTVGPNPQVTFQYPIWCRRLRLAWGLH